MNKKDCLKDESSFKVTVNRYLFSIQELLQLCHQISTMLPIFLWEWPLMDELRYILYNTGKEWQLNHTASISFKYSQSDNINDLMDWNDELHLSLYSDLDHQNLPQSTLYSTQIISQGNFFWRWIMLSNPLRLVLHPATIHKTYLGQDVRSPYL